MWKCKDNIFICLKVQEETPPKRPKKGTLTKNGPTVSCYGVPNCGPTNKDLETAGSCLITSTPHINRKKGQLSAPHIDRKKGQLSTPHINRKKGQLSAPHINRKKGQLSAPHINRKKGQLSTPHIDHKKGHLLGLGFRYMIILRAACIKCMIYGLTLTGRCISSADEKKPLMQLKDNPETGSPPRVPVLGTLFSPVYHFLGQDQGNYGNRLFHYFMGMEQYPGILLHIMDLSISFDN